MSHTIRALVLACLALATAQISAAPPASDRPRLLVLTDISSLTAGKAEPDDGQSLIRLMLYANELQIEGLVASSNLGHGRKVRPDLIRQVVDAYARVQPNLKRHDSRYPSASDLAKLIKAGQPVPGRGCRSSVASARGRTPRRPLGSSTSWTGRTRARCGS